jgi:hypothetical protein
VKRPLRQIQLISIFASALLASNFAVAQVASEEPKPSRPHGNWSAVGDFETTHMLQMQLEVHAQPEPQPALKYRLIDDVSVQKDRNAAVYYLRAIGFLEEGPARDALTKYCATQSELAKNENKSPLDLPPYVWETMKPSDLPIDDVKKYLSLKSFQPRDLREAQQCKYADFERHIENSENPAGVLLSDVAILRYQVARDQILRCRLAIAEDRIDDAFEVMRQQFATARHLGQDVTLVSNLIGCSIAEYALDDLLMLIQHPDCPNLYWALASLPDPLVSLENSLDFEGRFLFEQNKLLKQIDRKHQNDELTQLAITQLAESLVEVQIEGWYPLKHDEARVKLVKAIETSAPAAREYLEKVVKTPTDEVESMETNHLGLVAIVEYAKSRGDKLTKLAHLPFWQLIQTEDFRNFSGEQTTENAIGELTAICHSFAATPDIYRTQAKIQRRINLLQCVEAVRMYAAENDGKLPSSLEDMRLPAPLDPFTDIGFEYSMSANHFSVIATPRIDTGLQIDVTLK